MPWAKKGIALSSDQVKILLVEDDAMIASGLVFALEQEENYEVRHCITIEDALQWVESTLFDLAILDMQLPDGVGFQVQDALKDRGTAVLFLSVVDDEANIVRALESGAADYVTKPFRLRELLARIKGTLSKMDKGEEDEGTAKDVITVNGVTVEPGAGKAYLHGKLLNLTTTEYRLLLILLMNRGRVLTRHQILDEIWDESSGFIESNTLSVYIKRLRAKLDGELNIETERGVGYRVN